MKIVLKHRRPVNCPPQFTRRFWPRCGGVGRSGDNGWRVGVGAEGDGQISLGGQFQEGAAGIDFAAILAQAGGVEFDGDIGLPGGIEEAAEHRGAVLAGPEVEFFRQIGVADDFKEAGLCRLGQPGKIEGPDLERVGLPPEGKLFGIVQGPGIRNVVD